MTLDEAIKYEEEAADSHRRIMKVRAITEYDLISANNHRQLAEWLKELKQLREQTSWIPVTERLPDDYDRYLITTDDGRVEIIGYGYTDDLPDEVAFHEWDDEGWQCWKPNVTAWMPRPKPYEPQESEDKCKNCEYYRNPDYTRCHECKAESEDKE